MTDLLRSTAERAIRYLSDLPQRSVAPSTEALQALRQFDEPLPDDALDPIAARLGRGLLEQCNPSQFLRSRRIAVSAALL